MTQIPCTSRDPQTENQFTGVVERERPHALSFGLLHTRVWHVSYPPQPCHLHLLLVTVRNGFIYLFTRLSPLLEYSASSKALQQGLLRGKSPEKPVNSQKEAFP